MRLSNTAIVLSVLAGTVMALPALTPSALAVQDTPTRIDGVGTVCTGVGSAKDDPRWSNYPLKIVLATSSGADLAGAHVVLSQGGKTVAETDCDGPWVLFQPPQGDYRITASLVGGSGLTRTADVSVGKGGQKTVTLTFQRQTAQ